MPDGLMVDLFHRDDLQRITDTFFGINRKYNYKTVCTTTGDAEDILDYCPTLEINLEL